MIVHKVGTARRNDRLQKHILAGRKKKVAGESISELMCPIAIGPLSKASAKFYY